MGLGFSQFFPIGFFPLFFSLVDVGQHLPTFVFVCVPPAPCCLCVGIMWCVVCSYIFKCNDFVWRAQQAPLGAYLFVTRLCRYLSVTQDAYYRNCLLQLTISRLTYNSMTRAHIRTHNGSQLVTKYVAMNILIR